MARVAVVIPNWNGRHWLAPCLAALRQQEYADFRTVLVDNGSSDGSVAFLAETHPEVEVVALRDNLGFAGGMNAGFAAAPEAEYLCALNNDTVADPGFLAALVRALDDRPDAGSAAALMLDMNAPGIVDTAGDGWTLSGRPFKLARGLPAAALPSDPFEVLSPSAGACLYRAAMLAEVGSFCERYFAYMEDVDLGLRAQLAGWSCVAVPQARVLHAGAASSGGTASAFALHLTSRNMLWTAARCAPLPLMVPMLVASLGLQAAVAVTGRPRSLAPFRRSVLRGMADGLRGLPAMLASRRAIPRKIGTAEMVERMRRTMRLNRTLEAAR